ncbi:hypothetical protein VTO42DRAFT_5574 [Malbranchea cinnamomea]
MTLEPSENAIAEFVGITNVTRDKAIAFLKANNLDSNRAIDAYFENPDGPGPVSQAWSTVSTAPQEAYGYQSQNVMSDFDTDPTCYGIAPSRPPSETSMRERHEGVNITRAVEMSTETSVSMTHQITALDRDDHEMQQALALSLSDNPNYFSQETGIVSASGSNLRPAYRDHYEEVNWALTLPSSEPREVCVDPDPEERKKIDGQPAFLRPAEDQDYLPALLTIFHAIPLARESLLCRKRVATDYGHDAQWWNGQTISLPPRALSTGFTSSQPSSKDDVVLEAQRLMAFLDGTKRAFGSTAALASIRTVGSWGAEKLVEKFLESWQSKTGEYKSDDQQPVPFLSRIIYRPDRMEEEPDEKSFMIADLSVGFDCPETLYDVIDASFWADMPDKELEDIWLDHVADVFTIRLTASMGNNGVGVRIPAVWYPDRYMESCREYAIELRKRKLQVEQKVERLQNLIDQISEGEGVKDGARKFRELMEETLAGSRIALNNHRSSDGQEFSDAMRETLEQFASQLRSVADQVERKLIGLEKEKTEALEGLADFSRRLTSPSASPDEPPQRRYTLRGVCTLPHVMYVLKRREIHTEPTRDSPSEGETDGWQWWRISFSVDDAAARLAEVNQQPVVPSSVEGQASADRHIKRRRISVPSNTDVLGYTARPVREIEVLRAAKEESSTVLLVYASDKAVNFQEDVLPPPLQVFVDTDNKAFEEEIQSAFQQEKATQKENIPPTSSESPVQLDPFTSIEPKLGYSLENPDIQERSHRASPMPEMQEKRGPGLIASTRHLAPTSPSGPMDLIEEEDASDAEFLKVNLDSAPAAST